MASPDPTITIADGGGAAQPTTNGANVTPGNVVTVALSNPAGVNSWALIVASMDDLTAAPVLTINALAKTATFTAPAAGAAIRLQSTVVGATAPGNSTTACAYTLTGTGQRTTALNETTEGSAGFGWLTKLNTMIRTSAAVASTYTVDAASGAVSSGDWVCVTATGTVTRAVLAALNLAGAVLGVAITAGTAGQTIGVLMEGLVNPTLSGVATFGPTRCNTTTARLEVVSSFAPGDYLVGFSNAQGYVTMVRGIVLPAPLPFAPPAGCKLWLKGDTGIATGATFTWTDQSGNLNNFTKGGGANQPTVVTGINGLQCVQFTQLSSQYLTGPSFSALVAADIFVVLQNKVAGVVGNGLWQFGSASAEYWPFGDQHGYLSFGSSNVYRDVAGGVLNPDARIAQSFEIITTSSEWTFIQNSTQIYTNATNTVSFLAAGTLLGAQGGGTFTPANYSDNQFGEIIMFDHKLSAVDRAYVRSYIKTKWGTP